MTSHPVTLHTRPPSPKAITKREGLGPRLHCSFVISGSRVKFCLRMRDPAAVFGAMCVGAFLWCKATNFEPLGRSHLNHKEIGKNSEPFRLPGV